MNITTDDNLQSFFEDVNFSQAVFDSIKKYEKENGELSGVSVEAILSASIEAVQTYTLGLALSAALASCAAIFREKRKRCE